MKSLMKVKKKRTQKEALSNTTGYFFRSKYFFIKFLYNCKKYYKPILRNNTLDNQKMFSKLTNLHFLTWSKNPHKKFKMILRMKINEKENCFYNNKI